MREQLPQSANELAASSRRSSSLTTHKLLKKVCIPGIKDYSVPCRIAPSFPRRFSDKMLFTVTFLSASARFDVLMHKSTAHPLILVQAPEMCRRPHTYQKNYPPWNESISHLRKRKIIDSRVLFFGGGDMLVSFGRVSFFKHPKVNLFFVVHLSSHSPPFLYPALQFPKKKGTSRKYRYLAHPQDKNVGKRVGTS